MGGRDKQISLQVDLTKEEEEEGLSLKLWVVAISLAVIVTLALLTITLLVCLRYRRLTLVPVEAVDQVDQVEGSTTSYDSRHGLLYNYNYTASQTGKLPGRQSLDRQSSLGSSCREGQNFVFTREKKGGTAQIYKGTEQHYASTPIVRQEYSRPFQYVLVDRGE